MYLLDNSDKTLRLKEEFSKKLPKLSTTFHDEYFKLFNTGRWIQFPQVENGRIWDNYMYILNQVNDLDFIILGRKPRRRS